MDLRATVLWTAVKRRLLRDRPFVIAITGSIAKTSTKQAVGAVLRAAYGEKQVRVGFGNLNTELGVPLAILGFELDFYQMKVSWQWAIILIQALWAGLFGRLPRYLVLEMGAERPGDLAKLTAFVKPDIGVVTVIGEAHLMNYSSQEALANEKAEVVRAVKPNGVAVIYHRGPFRDLLVNAAAVPVVEFDCDVADIARTVAMTIGRQLEIEEERITRALASTWQPAGRMRIIEGEYTVIDDSYNASPTSMRSALEQLSKGTGRRVAVLGAMLELGDNEERFHEEVGQYARKHADYIIAIGELAKHYRADEWYETSDEAAAKVVAFLRKGDSILVKGSHGIRTDKIVEAIT